MVNGQSLWSVVVSLSVQWMTAGRGIVHSEMPRGEETCHGLQLWVNLQKADKIGGTPVSGTPLPEYPTCQQGWGHSQSHCWRGLWH